MESVRCDYCGVSRNKANIIHRDVCADGVFGSDPCCVVNQCAYGCEFICDACNATFDSLHVVSLDTVVSIPNRKFQCVDCFASTQSTRHCDHHWKIIRDGRFDCTKCGKYNQLYPVDIWYGVSIDEWESRY